MKRFRFSLRPVAVLRAHQEMRAREAFATAVQAFVRAEQELAAARERVQRFADDLTAGRAQSFSAAAQIQAITAYRRECDAEVEAGKAVAAARQAMDAKRVEYIEAHRKLEVVHRLEEKARAKHRYETMHEEQAEFDDYATQKFARASMKAAAGARTAPAL